MKPTTKEGVVQAVAGVDAIFWAHKFRVDREILDSAGDYHDSEINKTGEESYFKCSSVRQFSRDFQQISVKSKTISLYSHRQREKV